MSSSPTPILLSVTHASMARGDTMSRRLKLHLRRRGRVLPRPRLLEAASRYMLCDDEKRFAQQLMHQLPHLWLFRARQNAFTGDFALVDMSSADPQQRTVVVVELKRSGVLVEGGGGCSNQLSRYADALVELEQRQLVKAPRAVLLCGGGTDVIARLSKRTSTTTKKPWAA